MDGIFIDGDFPTGKKCKHHCSPTCHPGQVDENHWHYGCLHDAWPQNKAGDFCPFVECGGDPKKCEIPPKFITKEPTDREQAYEKLGLVDPMPGTYQRIIAEELSSLRSALAEKMAQLERLRLALERIQKLGTSRTLPGRTFDGIKIPSKSFENEYAKIAREALAATEPRDLTKPRNYGSIEVEGAKSD